MVNIVKRTLSDGERHFIDTIASLLTPWGMAPLMARVYGYLLLNEEPVSLDRIAIDLQISKVGAWKAARALEEFGHVHRYGAPGSKRAYYGPTDSFETPMIKQSTLLAALGRLMQTGASTIASGDAAVRLKKMSRFYLAMRKAMEVTIKELHTRKPGSGK